jgi:hypothetical protein
MIHPKVTRPCPKIIAIPIEEDFFGRKPFTHNKENSRFHPMPTPPQPFYIPLARRRF